MSLKKLSGKYSLTNVDTMTYEELMEFAAEMAHFLHEGIATSDLRFHGEPYDCLTLTVGLHMVLFRANDLAVEWRRTNPSKVLDRP